ncbi:MAG: energy-coupling factor ABC transporter substrate-binding protein [Anaerolineae bacterium]|nr:energy-coupling factor ABC transporter substrate-binding protein [Anaerolineae bacterium]
MKKTDWVLVLLVVVLALAPLYIARGAEFNGADAEAEQAVTEIRPDYEPWSSPIFEPPSGEIESLIFAVQAAMGAGVLAYFFGYRHGLRQHQRQDNKRD